MSTIHPPKAEDIQGIEEFLAFTKTFGFARSNRFMVDITPPPIMLGRENILVDKNNIKLLCEEVVFPGQEIKTRSMRVNGLTYQRAQILDYKQNSMSMTFLVDSGWKIREFFETWIRTIVSQENDGSKKGFDVDRPHRLVQFYDDYISDIDLVALNPVPRERDLKVTVKRTVSVVVEEAAETPPVVKKSLKSIIIDKVKASAKNRITSAISLKTYKDMNKLENRYQRARGKINSGIRKNFGGIVGDIANDIIPSHIYIPLDVEHISDILPPEMLGYDPETGLRRDPPEIPRSEPHIKKGVELGYDSSGDHINKYPVESPSKAVSELATFIIQIHEAYPVSIEAQTMSSNSGNQYQRLKVNFVFNWNHEKYIKFVPEKRKINYDLNDLTPFFRFNR